MRNAISQISVVLVTLLLTHTVHAQRERDTWTSVQPLEVSGKVQLPEGQPASGVLVRLERFSGGIIDQMPTDNLGRFRFAGHPRGYYTVTVEAPGFATVSQNADLQLLPRAFLMFELIRIKSTATATTPVIVDARVPTPAREAFAKAQAALLEKKTKDAIPQLEKAVALYAEFFDAYLLLATSYLDLREWVKAEQALRQALKIKPDHSTALLMLGEVYWRQKKLVEAAQALKAGLDLDDMNWHGHFTLARLYWDQGEIKKVAQSVARTLQLKPDFAEAHLLAGNVLLKLGEQQRAIVEYREYLRLAPKGAFATEARNLIHNLESARVK